MVIHLIVQYYRCGDPQRQQELDTCLIRNAENPLIGRIHLLTEEAFRLPSCAGFGKITQTVVGERLTYERAFRYANQQDPSGSGVWILSNADLSFDDTLAALDDVTFGGFAYALSRYDIRPDGSLTPCPPELAHGSQDAWIFRPPLDLEKMSVAFCVGIPGCDQRIAHELIASGLILLNPSKRIVARHLDLARGMDAHARARAYAKVLHAGGHRTGGAVEPPYQRWLQPTAALTVSAHELFTSNLLLTEEVGGLRTAMRVIEAREAWQPLVRLRKLLRRWYERRIGLDIVRRSSLFDAGWYCRQNPDVERDHWDPAEHYLRMGAGEGRDPGPAFSTTTYLRFNPDVMLAGMNPLVHYERFGRNEGRAPHG